MTTTLRTSQAAAHDAPADAVIIGITEGPAGPVLAPGSEGVDAAFGGRLAETLATIGATGKQDEVTRIASAGQLPAPVVAAVGIGTADGGQPAVAGEPLRRAAGAAVRVLAAARTAQAGDTARAGDNGQAASGNGKPGGSRATQRITLCLPATDPAEAEAVALGALLGGYSFRRYAGDGGGADVELTLLGGAGYLDAAVARAQVLADAICLARDLVNTGPSDLFPASLADEAGRVARASGLDLEVLDEQALSSGGYGGITGVGQGSAHPPRLVRLGYTHPAATRTVVFAGKGITFDSGGLSLKQPVGMEVMKSDMGGAAAVLAALQVIAALRPEVNVVGYLPLAENMPGGRAQRPSDVISIYGGKTVEVLNTDAEGRLVLADALARSAADAPDLLIDVATLTGAQLVALGPRICGVMANSDEVLVGVVDAAHRAGEAAWPMPLPAELRKGLDSTVADLANVTGDRNGGMLVGGLFLREFVPDGVRWAHIDIAGPAYHSGEPYGYTQRGGTGAAIRTLVQVAADVADGRL